MKKTVTITTLDKQELKAYCYSNPKEILSKGNIVICPATGVFQSFYNDIALYLVGNGFTVYTFNYRGIELEAGKTLKGFDATLADWAIDIQSIATHIKEKEPELPLFALAHSIGGQLLSLTKEPSLWDGILTVASQSGYWKHFEGKYKMIMWLFWYFFLPVTSQTVGYFPAKRLGLFENLPKGVALQWSKWGRSPAYMKSEFSKEYFEKITCKIKAYSLADDQKFAPKINVDWLHQQYTNAIVERLHINPKDVGLKKIGHFNFFRKSMENIFWKDVNSFFQEYNK